MAKLRLLLLLLLLGGVMQAQTVIYHHAKFYLVNSSFDAAEAMCVQEGKIKAVGSLQQLQQTYPKATLNDLGGKYVYPGFIDAHCHFTGYAMDMYKCNLIGTKSYEEILQKLVAYAPDAPGLWIYGRGWDQNDWAIKQYPNRKELDRLFPDRPVILKRIDGHAVLCNAKALQMAGITTKTHIEGGEVEVKNGELTGILIDNAMAPVENIVPGLSKAQAIAYFKQAEKDCFELGLTSVQDCGVSHSTVQWMQSAYKTSKLKIRWYGLLSDNEENYRIYSKSGPVKADRMQVRGFKLYADGALGSRGACLLHPYTDKPGHSGFLLSDSLYFVKRVAQLKQIGFQVCTHAIGDSANRVLLRIYAHTLQQHNDLRWRIEHAQIVHDNDRHWFGDYDIIPSVQPTHATSDMYWAADRLGKDRMEEAYAYQSLLKQNGWLPLGTDFPVEYLNPLYTFYAAVVRKDQKGFPADGFLKTEGLTREQALRGMTIWAARAAFEESQKGSLEPGKVADFVVLDQDLMTAPESSLFNIKIMGTYCNGEKVY